MWSSPTLHQLLVFRAVLQEGSFARAAERLSTDHSTVSRHIQSLQKALSVELFHKTPQGMVPTKAGAAYAQDVYQLLQIAHEAYYHALYISTADLGPFRVGYSPYVHSEVLPFVQSASLPMHDTRSVQFSNDASMNLVKRVQHGELHAAFGIMPIVSEYLKIFPLLEEPIGVWLPEKHTLAGHSRLSLHQLRHEMIYWLPRKTHPAYYDHIVHYLRSVGFHMTQFREARRFEQAFAFIAHAGGITFAPRSAEALHPAGIVFRSLSDSLMKSETCFFVRRDRVNEQDIANFTTLVLDTFLHRNNGARTKRNPVHGPHWNQGTRSP